MPAERAQKHHSKPLPLPKRRPATWPPVKGLARQGEGSQLVARARRHHLFGDAIVPAEGHPAVDFAGWRGKLEAAGYCSVAITTPVFASSSSACPPWGA